jgi:hypothetical protein
MKVAPFSDFHGIDAGYASQQLHSPYGLVAVGYCEVDVPFLYGVIT